MRENGSSRAPNFELVRHTPFATAPILPRRRLSIVMNRSALPSRCVRRTTASSRQVGTSILSLTCPSSLDCAVSKEGSRKLLLVSQVRRPQHPSGAGPLRTPQDRLPIHVGIVTDGNGALGKGSQPAAHQRRCRSFTVRRHRWP